MKKSEGYNIFDQTPTSRIEGDLSGRYREAWAEESFYFEQKTGRQVVSPHSNDHLGTSFNSKKSRYFFVFILVIFSLFFVRVFYLQIIKGRIYSQVAESNRQRLLPIPAERGLIFDRNGIQLTKNIPNFSLAVIPQDIPREKVEKAKVITRLAELTGKNTLDISNLLEEYGTYSYESIVLQEDIDYDTALKILIGSAELPGIQIQRGSKRLYLGDIEKQIAFPTSTPSSFSHLFGYMGKLNKVELDELYKSGYLPSDNIGKTGLEKIYETALRGTYGKKRIEVNAAGKEQSILAEEAPVPGKLLRLTIDAKLQAALEKILTDNLKASQKQRASAIVLNPQNGEVLAMVSLPAYDNNDFSGGIKAQVYQRYLEDKNHPLFNRAISGTYPSGSTVKPAIAAAGLEEKIINSATSFLSTGGLSVGAWFFPDWQAGGHGVTNVRKSLAWSVNTFYYYLGGGYGDFVGLGVEKIAKYLKLFGFAEKTGIDLPGEQVGFVPSKEWKEKNKNEKWYVGDTYNLSIGQGDLLVTPLQIANMTVAVANGGNLFKPHLVQAIVDPVNKQEQIINPELIRNDFVKQENLQIVRLGMRDCVVYGSCHRLSSLPINAAAKTGTAQWNSEKDNHAWFTSFAPYDNPQIVVTVMVEEGQEGSGVSSRVAYDFYRWWVQYKINAKPQ